VGSAFDADTRPDPTPIHNHESEQDSVQVGFTGCASQICGCQRRARTSAEILGLNRRRHDRGPRRGHRCDDDSDSGYYEDGWSES